jgi:protein-S-isoprenylcysteine O-methyltransferase Ste14
MHQRYRHGGRSDQSAVAVREDDPRQDVGYNTAKISRASPHIYPDSQAILGIVSVLVLSALDHRFVWSPPVPTWVCLAGDLLVALGFVLFFLVLRSNSYAASNVEVSERQQLVSTGPYGIVRHPMYAAAVLMGVGMPLALGSWWGVLVAVVGAPAYLIVRILDDEMLPKSDLLGYTECMRRVRYRLVPHVW